MAQYKVLKPWDYNPTGLEPAWLSFLPGQTIVYPGTAFPTALPITWLINQGAIQGTGA